MTLPPQPPHPSQDDGDEPRTPHDAAVDLDKHGTAATEPPFDPYRFGKPDHPVPPEFAPPGYVADPPPAAPSPYGPPANPYATNPYGDNPYGANPYQSPPWGPPAAGYQMPPPNSGQQGPSGYGYPAYGAPGPGAPQGNNGKAIAGMVLGIASIPFFFLSVLDLALIIPGLVLAIIGLGQAKRRGGKGRSQAIAGIVCVSIGTVAATAYSVYLFSRVGDCVHYARDGDNAAYQQCVHDRFR